MSAKACYESPGLRSVGAQAQIYVLPIGVGLFLGILVGLSVWSADSPSADASPADTRIPQVSSEGDGKGSPINQAVRATMQGKAERDRRIAENPDAYFDPDRTDPWYQAQVRRHNQIGQFLSSTRRDDPSYRKILTLLLENGYGIEEWTEAVSILGFHHLPVVLKRHSLMEAGFSPQQVEDHLGSAKLQQQQQLRLIHDNLRARCGIDDPELMDTLIGVELEFLPNEEVLGLGPLRTIRGDKLYTDEDWLDAEFAAAKARYQGAPKVRVSEFGTVSPEPSRHSKSQSGPLPIREQAPAQESP